MQVIHGLIGTGLKMQVPKGYVALIQERGSITKTPLNFDLTCLISRKIMTGLNRDKLSKITFGDPSVNDGRTKILF